MRHSILCCIVPFEYKNGNRGSEIGGLELNVCVMANELPVGLYLITAPSSFTELVITRSHVSVNQRKALDKVRCKKRYL